MHLRTRPLRGCSRRPKTLLIFSEIRTSQQLLKEDISNLSKDSFADHCCVVSTPSLDERIQILDKFNLLRVFVATHLFSQCLLMSLDSCRAWFNEGLEAMQFSVPVVSRLGSACRVLPNMEAQKVESYLSIHCFQRVSDTGLAWL